MADDAEQLGVELFVQGFAKFLKAMKLADKAMDGVEKSAKKTGKMLAKGLAKGINIALKGFGKLAKIGLRVAASLAKIAFKGIVLGAGAAAAAVAGLVTVFGKLAIEAAPLVGIGESFETLSKKFGVSLEAMKQAAGGTITSFELMRQANVALTGASTEFGKQFGEALPKLLEGARAAAKATGQDVDFLFESLVNGIKKSSPLLIDNTGLVLSLGEANQTLADELGKAVTELTAEEKQIAILRATMKASEQMVADFGGGQAGAAEQIAQFKTAIQEAKDEIGIAFLPVLQTLLDTFGTIITDTGPKLVEAMQSIAWFMNTTLRLAIEGVGLAFDGDFRAALLRVRAIVQTIFGPEGVAIFDDWKMKVGEIALGIETTLAPLRDAVMDVFNTLSNWWVLHGDDIRESASDMFTTFAEVGQNLVDNIIPFIVEQLEKFSEWVEVNGPLISDFLQQSHETWAALAVIVGDFWLVVEPILDGLITLILNVGKFIMELATGDWDAAFATMDTIVNDAMASIEAIWLGFANWVTGWFDTDWAAVVKTWTDTWENMKEIVRLATEKVIKWFVDLGIDVVQALSDISDFIMNKFKEAAEWLWEQMDKLKRVFQNVRDVIDGLRERIQKLKKDILELVLPGWLNPGSPAPLETALIGIANAVDLTTDSFGKLQNALNDINLASKFSAPGSFFSRIFAKRRIDPLKDELEAQQQLVDEFQKYVNLIDSSSPRIQYLYEQLGLEKEKLVDLTDKLAAREEKLAELQKQQADVAFLKQQLQLLQLIKEQGLDAGDILGGIQLGLEASAADLTVAMSTAMQQIVTRMTQELGLSSPVTAQPSISSTSSVINNQTTNFNLTTESITRPEALSMEFSALELAAAVTR